MSLLDLVLRCDEHDLHRVVWTDDVLEELVEVWVRNDARSEASARAIIDQVRSTFEDQQNVRADYEHLIDEMLGQDEDDHLHGAAAVAAAPSILSWTLCWHPLAIGTYVIGMYSGDGTTSAIGRDGARLRGGSPWLQPRRIPA